MGLLDGLLPQDPEQRAAVTRGLLSAGLQLMQARGKFLPALGQGGVAGLGGFEQERQRQLQAKRIGLQDELLKGNIEEQKRQAELTKLPNQFYRAPSSPAVDATGGMETAVEAPQNASGPGGFDLPGYIQALMGKNPVQALQLQASLQKEEKPISVAKDAVLLDPKTRQPIFSNVQPDTGSESPVAKLIRERDKFPIGDPTRRIFDEAIKKASTHQPPVSLNNYGTPLPIALEGGGTGYLQPPTRPGGPSQVLTVPGTGRAAVKPTDSREKDLTESQAKATAFLGQMRSASDSLKTMGFDQSSLSLQAETALAGGTANVAITQKAQRVRQAQDQWSEAFLRFKTGAASTPAEVAANRKTFFPTFGDKPETVALKARMRSQAERDMEIAAGRGTAQLNARDQQPSVPNIDAIDAELKRRGLK
jgi:hypothetical protein